MENWLSRTELLLGQEKLKQLAGKHVLVVGVGGVGAYAAEMLCRAGIGRLTLVDGDVVNPSNINRQLIALHSTVGMEKTAVLAGRLKDINPDLDLEIKQEFLEGESIDRLLEACRYDYVVDAIDTLTPKVELITGCLRRKQPVISSMGAGGRMDPSRIAYGDISETRECALARSVRTRLRKAGIGRGLKVVFSTEPTGRHALLATETERNKKSTVGTVSYMPAMFGCYLAAFVIRKLSD